VLCKIEDKLERVVDCMYLIESEMSDVLAQHSRVDCRDHFAHDARRLVVELDLGVKARRRR
jgi:hypothetical protein